MKANELRIGNFVKDDKDDYLGVVTGILSDYLVQVTYPSGVTARQYPEELAPVRLTDDILKKLSFKNIGGFFYKREIALRRMSIEEIHDSYELCGNGIIVEYLHNLQNLVFALTGDELTFADNHNPCLTDDPDDRCENCNCWKSTRKNCS